MKAKPQVLVVGGAGYIGSHMVLALQEAGYLPVVLDNLSKGKQNLLADVKCVIGEMNDANLLKKLFQTHSFSAVMHFASLIEVAESVQHPAKYYQNNLIATINLLDVMLAHGVKNFIFSSSAAVYGNPQYLPIDEVHPLIPINPYGRSKRMVEEIIEDYAKSYALNYAIFRYFNAAGADPKVRVGEYHRPESHLLPIVLQAAITKSGSVTVYGRDYPTVDGTCVRDYVHVSDLCTAHLLALQRLQNDKHQLIYNLGSGQGYSVQQVIDTVCRVTNTTLMVQEGERRQGDPAALVANSLRARAELGWQPKYSELEIIVDHAWRFMQHCL